MMKEWLVAEPTAQSFGEVLRRLRTRAGLTQEDLAERAKIAARTISDLERGQATMPHRSTVRRLASGLDLDEVATERLVRAARNRVSVWPGQVAARRTAIRTLPRDIASFTGRQAELGRLLSAGTGESLAGLYAIGGMAGVGKTAFAVHAAHRLAPRFPDGQVFISLHGHTPGRSPADPAHMLASLLPTWGVDATRMPADLEALARLWRDRLAGKRVLLVLDDAASTEQVWPLLPGSAGCLVLITSRRHLTALQDAVAISLDILPARDAADLVVRLAGRPGVRAADPAVAEISRLCGYLPLAMGMLARQLHHHPAWTLGGLAAELSAARDRLELMQAENLSVSAAFDLSYADLTPGQQQLFRRLGANPGTDFDACAVAALDGTDLAVARRRLRALYDHYLVAEPAPGRYRMHDLIRERARKLAATDEAKDVQAAVGRLLDYYQRTAADSGELAWLRAERANLLACVDYAASQGQDARLVELTAALAELLFRDGPWSEAISLHTAAVAAAARLADRTGQARALYDLGTARRMTGDCQGAVGDLQSAASIYGDLGDRCAQATALTELGLVRQLTGDHKGAACLLDVALDTFCELGDRRGQASALNALGMVAITIGDYDGAADLQRAALRIYRELGYLLGQAHAHFGLAAAQRLAGDYQGAGGQLDEALRIFGDVGDRGAQAAVLNETGTLHRLNGDGDLAMLCHQRALVLAQEIGSSWDEAHAHAGLGRCMLAAGSTTNAESSLRSAWEIFLRIGAAEASELTAEIDTLAAARAAWSARSA
jgi:transcriptional regulator with XRE-family HTH domain/tetratricopeptide (TPR) repeat protein